MNQLKARLTRYLEQCVANDYLTCRITRQVAKYIEDLTGNATDRAELKVHALAWLDCLRFMRDEPTLFENQDCEYQECEEVYS